MLLSAWNATSAPGADRQVRRLLIRYWMATSATLALAKTPVIVDQSCSYCFWRPVRAAQNNDTHALLPYQDVDLVSQTLFTGFMANPTATLTRSLLT